MTNYVCVFILELLGNRKFSIYCKIRNYIKCFAKVKLTIIVKKVTTSISSRAQKSIEEQTDKVNYRSDVQLSQIRRK